MFQRNNLDPGVGAIVALVLIVLLGGARFFAPLTQGSSSLDAGVLTVGALAVLASLGLAYVNRRMHLRSERARDDQSGTMGRGAVIDSDAIEVAPSDRP